MRWRISTDLATGFGSVAKVLAHNTLALETEASYGRAGGLVDLRALVLVGQPAAGRGLAGAVVAARAVAEDLTRADKTAFFRALMKFMAVVLDEVDAWGRASVGGGNNRSAAKQQTTTNRGNGCLGRGYAAKAEQSGDSRQHQSGCAAGEQPSRIRTARRQPQHPLFAAARRRLGRSCKREQRMGGEVLSAGNLFAQGTQGPALHLSGWGVRTDARQAHSTAHERRLVGGENRCLPGKKNGRRRQWPGVG